MYSSIVNKTNESHTQFERERIEILSRQSTPAQSSSYFVKFIRGKWFCAFTCLSNLLGVDFLT